MQTQLVHVDEFFSTARERYQIKLKRDAGEKRPWTRDQILHEWRFTNVHREDDRTTVWFREHIRDPLSKNASAHALPHLTQLVASTLIFRWFNRVETGEMIKDLLLYAWHTQIARERLTGISPVVTGAYIIKAGDGLSKLEGILQCIDQALPQLPKMVEKWCGHRAFKDPALPSLQPTLQDVWKDLKTLNYMGPFMAYEVVTDLRHTPVLDQATDIMTWGNLGPGAIRGIGRVVCDDPELFNNSATDQKLMLGLMARLLEHSKDETYWPQQWPGWEMHEVEMWLCEYAKYCNAKDGLRLKRRYSRD